MRLVASLEHYVASHSEDGVHIDQFAPATIRQRLANGSVRATVETAYPREGWLLVRVDEAPASDIDIAVRAPSWAPEIAVELNGSAQSVEPGADGYLHLRRGREKGDELAVSFPIRPRVVRPDGRIDAVRGCAAVERGPFVYCFESLEADGEPLDEVSILAPPRDFVEHNTNVAGEAVVELTCPGRRLADGSEGGWPYYEREGGPASKSGEIRLAAIPYYAWSNRGPL